jgi:hypothetical protein
MRDEAAETDVRLKCVNIKSYGKFRDLNFMYCTYISHPLPKFQPYISPQKKADT